MEVSPSTVTRLNDWSASVLHKGCTSTGSMWASVATKPSIVAMLGRIMPAPLAMPVTVTVRPPSTTWRLMAFGCVSVVMMACAARNQLPLFASAKAAGKPATTRSAGSCSMITPVENGSTCCATTPNWRAMASHTKRARARPSAPVPAFALPVLITIARMDAPAAKCSRHT